MTNKTKKSYEEKVASWDNQKLFEKFLPILDRLEIEPEFIETEEDLVTHVVLNIHCGDYTIPSHPFKLEWPLMPMPVPEAFQRH